MSELTPKADIDRFTWKGGVLAAVSPRINLASREITFVAGRFPFHNNARPHEREQLGRTAAATSQSHPTRPAREIGGCLLRREIAGMSLRQECLNCLRLDRGADRDGFGARRRRGAHHLRAAIASGAVKLGIDPLAFRRGAGDFDGARSVRTAVWSRPLRGLPDRQRTDEQTVSRLWGISDCSFCACW